MRRSLGNGQCYSLLLMGSKPLLEPFQVLRLFIFFQENTFSKKIVLLGTNIFCFEES